MRNIGRHDNALTSLQSMPGPTDDYLAFTVDDLYEGVKGCSVLTEFLSLIKSKQRERACRLLHQDLAHNRTILVVDDGPEAERIFR